MAAISSAPRHNCYVYIFMSKHHHIGLLTTGQGFLKSANKLNVETKLLSAPLPVYYLYCHAMELALKSYIYYKVQGEKELKAIGHDLESAWSRAEELGIDGLITECQELKECIAMINPIYRGKELEYFYPGLKRLPAIENVSNACNHLYKILDQHYRFVLRTTHGKGN